MIKKFLPEICKIQYGYAFDSAKFSDCDGIPLIRIRDVVRGFSETYTTETCSEDYIVNDGDMLIGMDGEFNIARWNGGKAYLNQRVCKLIPTNEVDALYLYYFMPKALKTIEDKTPFVTVKHLSAKELNKVDVPMPSMDEQKKIASSLQKVDELITLRKEQLVKLDQLVKSRFIELFGDPVQNPFGWSTRPLLEMGYCKNGMNFHAGDSGIEMHCLGVGDFKDYAIIGGTDHLPTISLNEAPSEESMLQDGDIVFVRSNGNKALVGRCVVVYPRNTPTTYSGFCIRYRLTSNEVNTAYLLRVLKTDSMRKKMAGRGANIQNLNQQILATLNIPLPPMDLQEQFAAFVEQTDKTKLVIQQSLDKLETLKKSLMQEYFG